MSPTLLQLLPQHKIQPNSLFYSYAETLPLLYTSYDFAFRYKAHFLKFLNLLPQHRFASLRRLHYNCVMPEELLNDHEVPLQEWTAFCEFFGSTFSPELHLILCLSNQATLTLIDGVHTAKRRPTTSVPLQTTEDGEEEEDAVAARAADVPRWMVPLVDLAERVHLELCIPLPTPTTPEHAIIWTEMGARHRHEQHGQLSRMVDLDRIKQGVDENGISPDRRRDHILKCLGDELGMGPRRKTLPN